MQYYFLLMSSVKLFLAYVCSMETQTQSFQCLSLQTRNQQLPPRKNRLEVCEAHLSLFLQSLHFSYQRVLAAAIPCLLPWPQRYEAPAETGTPQVQREAAGWDALCKHGSSHWVLNSPYHTFCYLFVLFFLLMFLTQLMSFYLLEEIWREKPAAK